jgi:hypothetical protein
MSQIQQIAEFSLYFPRVESHVNASNILGVLNTLGFLNVMRIDFAPIGKPAGYMANMGTDEYKSAFVHFHNGQIIGRDDQSHRTLQLIWSGVPYRFAFSDNTYWKIMKAINPIPNTYLNMHQMAEYSRQLELRVATLETQLFSLSRIMQDFVQKEEKKEDEWMPNMELSELLTDVTDLAKHQVDQHK